MSKTIYNLAAAFIGESQARNRYTFYTKTAKKEGFEKVSALFALTAEQENEHAKWLMRLINELRQKENFTDDIKVEEAEVPTTLGTTVENLKAAIAGENYEQTSMYPEFADTAQEEGYPEIAVRLRAIARSEQNHEARYQQALDEIEQNKMFEKGEEVTWVCRKCGYAHTGIRAVAECPSCGHPQAYFETK
jgi:rubrerythrin